MNTKLTVNIPLHIVRRAKARAALDGKTLTEIVRQSLEEYSQGLDLAGGTSASRLANSQPSRPDGQQIPPGLWPHFQEYEPERLDLEKDADLIIQRTLEFGTWEEVRWLFAVYGRQRVADFLRMRGERLLSPVTFNYWRKLLGIDRWQASPFPTAKGELWDR